MKATQVLIDLIQDNIARIHGMLDSCVVDCLHWAPDKDANSIAVTIWHATRACDVFMTQHILDKPAENEIWHTSGWVEKVGYNPIGIGTYGWGMVTGYTADEVRRIPRMNAQVLAGYFDEVMAVIHSYLENTPEEVLAAPAPGFAGKQTNYFWVRHPLFDLTRHVGEMLAVQAIWARKHS